MPRDLPLKALLLICLAMAACGPGRDAAPPAQPGEAANGELSPAGDRHPGAIVFNDKTDGRVWTKRAAEVPRTIAWVEAGAKWVPVVRIETSGAPGRREITAFGPGGRFLETSIQAPGPR